MFYKIEKATNEDKEYFTRLFPRISLLNDKNKELVFDAFKTAWAASDFEKIEDIKFSEHSDYPLLVHINDVVDVGLKLYEYGMNAWNDDVMNSIDKQELIMTLILHDLDKVMIVSRKGLENEWAKKMSHGFIAGMILNDLKAPEKVISIVSHHSSAQCNLRIVDPISMILKYSDRYSADHIFLHIKREPMFAKKEVTIK